MPLMLRIIPIGVSGPYHASLMRYMWRSPPPYRRTRARKNVSVSRIALSLYSAELLSPQMAICHLRLNGDFGEREPGKLKLEIVVADGVDANGEENEVVHDAGPVLEEAVEGDAHDEVVGEVGSEDSREEQRVDVVPEHHLAVGILAGVKKNEARADREHYRVNGGHDAHVPLQLMSFVLTHNSG
eukprot:CAMPEP_0177757324 /NCGR_PEP_ID=MMETSP0491_2-20121128/3580_1 /TAXON_ID=63592 /ORGANISM="Tetraselmis chuii, Strain PLY429" /LENGTH=184 /DNA_ID=CAMNT_0019272963 /DNA_START=324 /DNA_END=878 /DNA_ORIENTATION=-